MVHPPVVKYPANMMTKRFRPLDALTVCHYKKNARGRHLFVFF